MLELVDVRVAYDDTVAVDGVSLTVNETETVALLGPSGSGKSTLLRAMAGLEPLASGRISLNGRDLAAVPVHKRGIGLMFQDYVLFPQRDVRDNVAFGLEMRGDARGSIDSRVDEVLALVGLSGYGSRGATELSGGEQQRVALARALAPTPRLLMLDEPLGALDRVLRTRLLEDLAAMFRELRLPIVYVTHDQEEALAVADRVALMNRGRLDAVASPAQLWSAPPTEFAARFLGFNNIGDFVREGDHAQTEWGSIPVAADAPERGRLLLRPDGVRVDADGTLAGTIRASTFRGDHTHVLVELANHSMLEIDLRGDSPPLDSEVRLAVDPARVNFLS